MNEVFAKAFVALSGELKSVTRGATNPFFGSKYATLDSIIEETKPVLQKHGFAIMQMPETHMAENRVFAGCLTTLLHESGEMLQCKTMLPVDKTDPQGCGLAFTYARRYGWTAILGLALDNDDDGNAASNPSRKEERPLPVRIKAAAPAASDDLAKQLEAYLAEHTIDPQFVLDKLIADGKLPDTATKLSDIQPKTLTALLANKQRILDSWNEMFNTK